MGGEGVDEGQLADNFHVMSFSFAREAVEETFK